MPRILGESREGEISIRRRRGINVIEAPIYYKVLAENNRATRLDAITTPGLPQVGITNSVTLGMCVAKDAVRDVENPRLWYVTATFSTEVQEGFATIGGQLQHGNPTTWVPIAELNFERYDKVFVRDWSGTLYCNSKKQPFADGLTIPMPVTRMDFFQFEPISLSYRQIAERNGTMNNAVFAQVAAKKLACYVTRAVVGNWYGFRCWMVEYSVLHMHGNTTWQHERLDVTLDGVPLNGSGTETPNTLPAVLKFDAPLKPVDFSEFIRLPEVP